MIIALNKTVAQREAAHLKVLADALGITVDELKRQALEQFGANDEEPVDVLPAVPEASNADTCSEQQGDDSRMSLPSRLLAS